jgi:hypothetical protein
MQRGQVDPLRTTIPVIVNPKFEARRQDLLLWASPPPPKGSARFVDP